METRLNRIKHGLLSAEALLALVAAWALVFLAPWRIAYRVLGQATSPRAGFAQAPAQTGRARGVAHRVTRLADRLPWTSTCLVRALAGVLLLRRRGMRDGAIRLGCRRNADGSLAAHAWLIWRGVIVMGGPEQDFQTIADLAPHAIPSIGRDAGGYEEARP